MKEIAPWKRAKAIEEFLKRRDGERCSETLQKAQNAEERSRRIEKAKGLSWLHPDYRPDGDAGASSSSSGPVSGDRAGQSTAQSDIAGAGKHGRLPSVGRASCRSSSFAPDWSCDSLGGSLGGARPIEEESEEESVRHKDSR